MHSISIINNEFLFHLILTVRKIIPNSEYFYILLFLFKFIPPILFTHALYSVHSSLFTLNKVFRSVTIFYHSNRNLNYKALCIFIYLFLIVLILLIGFIVIYLRYKSKKSYAFEKGTNRIKMIIKITTYLIIIVMFLYQHIMEVLLYGIIEVIFSYVDKSEFKERYEMHISGNEKYIFFGFNIIFFICMILIMLGALFITSNKIIKSQYGYKSSQSLYVSLTYCLLWSFQGAYSASYNLKEDLQEKYHVTGCYCIVIILFFDLLISVKRINFLSWSKTDYFIKIMNHFFLLSGIIDIFIYHFKPKNVYTFQKFYFITLALTIFNSICMTNWMDKLSINHFMKQFSKEIFNSSKNPNFRLFFQFYIITTYIKQENEKNYFIYKIIKQHSINCSSESCLCKRYNNSLTEKRTIDAVTFDKLSSKFISYTEKQIVENINNYSKENIRLISKLLYLHLEYLYTQKRANKMNIMYLSKFYLSKKRNRLTFSDAYLIYEIYHMIIDDKEYNREYSSNQNFLEKNIIFEMIQEIMEGICISIEKIMQYKNLKNTNSFMFFKCEDILNNSKLFYQKNKYLITLLKNEISNNVSDFFIELKFLIIFFVKLFQLQLPFELEHLINEDNDKQLEYEDVLQSINTIQVTPKKNNFIIMLLNNENKFIINYISIELAEFLMFPLNSIKGMNFHDFLLPKYISEYHEIYMKNFIFFGGMSYKKTTFILNSKNQLNQIDIRCKVLPSFSYFFSLIVQVDNKENNDYRYYSALLNSSYDAFALSQSFEEKFYLNQNTITTIKVNLCDYFGISKERINDSFKDIKQEFLDKLSNLRLHLYSFPASTTISKNEYPLYSNVDPSYFKQKTEKKIHIKKIMVNKDKLLKSISNYCNSIEILNQEPNNRGKRSWHIKGTLSSNEQTYSVYTKMVTRLTDSSYMISFQLKTIGNDIYYIFTISESKDKFDSNDTITKLDLNGLTSYNNKSPTSRFDLNSYNESVQYPQKGSYLFSPRKSSGLAELSNEFDKLNFGKNTNITNDSYLNQSSNVSRNLSSMGLNSPNVRFKTNDKLPLVPETPASINPFIDVNKKYFQVQIAKNLIVLILVMIATLNCIDIALNNSSREYSLDLFYINAFAIFITNDIYFGALSTINACLVNDNIQTGNITNLKLQIKQSSKDVIDCFYWLNYYTNRIIDKPDAGIIYDLFNDDEEYSQMLSNWDVRTYHSNLNDEIYSVYHYFRTFNQNEDAYYCRIKKIFIDKNVNKYTETPTKEEKLLYYICANLINKIAYKLEILMKESTNLLIADSNNSKLKGLYITIAIIVLSILIFGLVILSMYNLLNIISKLILFIFTKRDNEDILIEDIKKFKVLIYGFTFSNSIEYTLFKMGIGNLIESKRKERKVVKVNKKYYSPRRRGLTKKSRKAINSVSNNMKKEENEEKTMKTNSIFLMKTKPKFGLFLFILIVFVFIIYYSFQITNLLISLDSYDRIILENNFGTNIFERGPKINEITLYSLISVLMNDICYITKDPSNYGDFILSNLFDIDINLNDNSIFQSFDNSNYIYLYYQIYIIRTNINSFLNSNKKGYLKTTTENEFLFDDEDNFCIIAAYKYLLGYYNTRITDFRVFAYFLSDRVQNCRTVGNGLNMSGHNSAVDLFLQQLTNLYSKFKKGPSSTRQLTFFKEPDLIWIEDNVLNVFRHVQFADAYSVIDDIEYSYRLNNKKKVSFSITSIIFSAVIIMSLFLIINYKFDSTITILKSFVDSFDRVISHYRQGN